MRISVDAGAECNNICCPNEKVFVNKLVLNVPVA